MRASLLPGAYERHEDYALLLLLGTEMTLFCPQIPMYLSRRGWSSMLALQSMLVQHFFQKLKVFLKLLTVDTISMNIGICITLTKGQHQEVALESLKPPIAQDRHSLLYCYFFNHLQYYLSLSIAIARLGKNYYKLS